MKTCHGLVHNIRQRQRRHMSVAFLQHASTMGEKLQERGFVLTPKRILSAKTCQAVKDRIPSLFRGDFETGVYPDEWHWREGISRDDVTREMCNTWKSDRLLASILLAESMGQLVANVMGWSSVRIAQDDLLWKPPGHANGTVVGFHQDSAYISSQFEPYENNSVTVWIALDDADEETGCLQYVAGSHKWTRIHQEESTEKELSTFHTCNAETYHLSLPQRGTPQPAPVQEGYALFHHQDIWHGSGPNRSLTKHRRALVGHYIRGDVKFCEGTSSPLTPWGETSYIYGRYKTFQSTNVDDSFFPIIYGPTSSAHARTAWLDDFISTI